MATLGGFAGVPEPGASSMSTSGSLAGEWFWSSASARRTTSGTTGWLVHGFGPLRMPLLGVLKRQLAGLVHGFGPLHMPLLGVARGQLAGLVQGFGTLHMPLLGHH